MNDDVFKIVNDIAAGLNEQYANAVAEPDVNFFPPDYDECLAIFLEDVAEALPGEEFDETELTEIFQDAWTGSDDDEC